MAETKRNRGPIRGETFILYRDGQGPEEATPRNKPFAADSPVLGGLLGQLLGVALCAAIIGLAIVIGVLVLGLTLNGTASISAMAIGALIVWRMSRRHESIVAKAAASIFGPVAFSLVALTLLLMIMNLFRMSVSDDSVAQAEQFLIDLRFAIAEALHIPLWLFCCVILVMIAITNVAQVRAVTIFLETKKRVGQFVAVLTALTSFTLFAQLPAGYLLEQRYNKVMTRFEASLRREKGAVAHAAAAQAIRNEVNSLPPARKDALRTVVTRFERIDVPEGVTVDTAVAQILEEEGLEESPSRPADDSRPLPRTHAEYAEVERGLDLEKMRANEAEKGAQKIVGEVIGSLVPELGGYAGKFVSKMVDGLAERLYGPLVERLFHRDAAFTTNVDALRSAAGASPHLGSASLSVVIDRVEPEANKRIAEKREADERMSRREQELGISDLELDTRLIEIRDFVRRSPALTDDQFRDVVAYADVVRSGKVPLYRDPIQLDLHMQRWKWVESAIAKEKALAFHEAGGGIHEIDPDHRVEHPDIHPEFHPIP